MTILKESPKFKILDGVIYYNSNPIELYLGYDYKEVLTEESLRNLLELMNLTPEFLSNSNNGKFQVVVSEDSFVLRSNEGDSMEFLESVPEYKKPSIDIKNFLELVNWYNGLFQDIPVFEYSKLYLTEMGDKVELQLQEERLSAFLVQSDQGPESFLTADREEFVLDESEIIQEEVITQVEFNSKLGEGSEPYLTNQGEQIVHEEKSYVDTDTTIIDDLEIILTHQAATYYKRCFITQELNNTVIDLNNLYYTEGVTEVNETEKKYPITDDCLIELVLESRKVLYMDLTEGVDIYNGISVYDKVITSQSIIKRINIYYEINSTLYS